MSCCLLLLLASRVGMHFCSVSINLSCNALVRVEDSYLGGRGFKVRHGKRDGCNDLSPSMARLTLNRFHAKTEGRT